MQLRQLIKSDPDYTLAALIYLFGEGKSFHCTEKQLLKILAKQYETTGFLSDSQLMAASRILPKYHNHLQGLEVKSKAQTTPVDGESKSNFAKT